MVVDEASWTLLQNTVKEDEILNERITRIRFAVLANQLVLICADIEQIEQRRASNQEMEALYILTPEPHIVDCILADLERKKYKQVSLLWTAR